MKKINIIDKFVIRHDSIILEAIELIQVSGSRSVIVVNEDKKAIGVISEGDIMRALLGGGNIHSRIESYMNVSFKYLTDYNYEQSYKYFLEGIDIVPIVDSDMKVKSIITILEFLKTFKKRQGN